MKCIPLPIAPALSSTGKAGAWAELHQPSTATRLPAISRPLLRWFTWYSRRYLRQKFHAVRVAKDGVPDFSGAKKIVIFLNHAAWFDPLVCLLAKERFLPGHESFAPMDETALQKYKFFSRLGMFAVEQCTARGARQFVLASRAILRRPQTALWLTPQARFADVRERPVKFQPGLAHLAQFPSGALFVPLAIEYVFWNEQRPEALLRFGPPLRFSPEAARATQPEALSRVLEQSLEANQDALAALAGRRAAENFETILHGCSGVGGVYDLWRRAKAWWRGEIFNPEHGGR